MGSIPTYFMLMQALRLTLAVTFVASATASEASAPPPAPSHPAVIQPIDWSLLCAVLGGAYTVVMILVS
jgi:invasion protein IalB